MVRSNLIDITQRQFDEVMEREAIEIEDYYTGDKYSVLFRKSTRGSKSNDSVIIYYPQETNIQKGTMFLLKGERYLVMTKDALESDVYFTSGAFRCNAEIIMYEGESTSGTAVSGVWYHKVPFVVNTLTAVNPSGSFVEVVNGNLSMYTSKKNFLSNVGLNNVILDFGGRFEVVNSFFLDGIHNFYLTKEPINQSDNRVGLLYIGDNLKVGDSIPLHPIRVGQDSHNSYDEDFEVEYVVSDATKAKVENGVLTLLAEGVFTITVKNDIGGADYITPLITVGAASPDPGPDPEPGLSWVISSLPDSIYVHSSYNTTVTCTPSETTDKVPTWAFILDDAEYTDPDIADYFYINDETPYSLTFKPTDNVLIGYDLKIAAKVDGHIVAITNTARIVY